MSKDKLVIDGKTYSMCPAPNFAEANAIIDISSTCQHSDETKTIFLGMHSIFSNLHPARFCIDNIEYSSVEQMLQSKKAALFDDDITHSKIMKESNPYKIKKLGSRVRNFSNDQWKQHEKVIALSAVRAKFAQNISLKNILLSTGSVKIVESSTDSHWGTGIHLHDRNTVKEEYWRGDGMMCEIYNQVHQELQC